MKMLKTALLLTLVGFISSFDSLGPDTSLSLTVKVDQLRNSNGVVQFTLYNKEGSIPDEHFENYYRQLKANIVNNSSSITFNNIPAGTYAINILHDENRDGKIDKGWFLPVEGIGFSNFKSISPLNRPNFKKAKFDLKATASVKVNIIYM